MEPGAGVSAAPANRCPCGEVHELSAAVRGAYEPVTAALPPDAVINVKGVGSWVVPKIYIAVHGLKADELPELAERYRWVRGGG
jgi:hypothetical protein